MEKNENLATNKNVLFSAKGEKKTALSSLAQQWIQWIRAQSGFDWSPVSPTLEESYITPIVVGAGVG
ncbi:hypothetical protein [Synechocystis sp. LEGE 06083]|uniref:hypothetical protein n=1 Tax=Synechocystis sp. LEGE 06083 TaxID=915336 RepID=UPI00187F180C|nr:hypothetical protein [Synechocystis sp. LEGE 06083]